MAYSETKVVIGGLAHIPIIIGFFYLIKRQYSFGAMLRTGKNALSDKVKPVWFNVTHSKPKLRF